MRRLSALAVVLLAPAVLACPVCGVAANEQGQEAYKVMSLILSVLPLLAIGAVVTWVVGRVRAAEKTGRAER
jgi:predicted cobalt transporter CbtA